MALRPERRNALSAAMLAALADGRRLLRCRVHGHAVGGDGRAGPDERTVDFDHAVVARLDGAELRVIADVGNRDRYALDDVDEPLPLPSLPWGRHRSSIAQRFPRVEDPSRHGDEQVMRHRYPAHLA